MTFQKKEKSFRVCIMQINYALILSAGLGTRMGEIGKIIPKVLWPIYAKTLLELQILYCEQLGIKNIYINTHFLHDEIIHFIKMNKLETRVTVLHEEVLLDSGGAIHNLASRPEVNYAGNLLLVNGDQFLFFKNDFMRKAIEQVEFSRAVLFGITVDKMSNYNEIVTKDDELKDIVKNIKKEKEYVTYSGLGLLKLDGLKKVPGISKFFETVVDYKNEKVVVITPDAFEYWDFGTAEIYAESIIRLANRKMRNTEMAKFLEKNNSFLSDEEKFVNEQLYSIDLNKLGRFSSRTIKNGEIGQEIKKSFS